ncbi:hypothetical protein BLA60_04530 [Actinophytocola xinjiangensis]|uniref:Uncharacterized protein n=1 Tax=Actinophytocola xinjiangensis TaxID=485602 RepID=A0A7Z1B097_9PSEU|nr:hypothetical protein [Actinophytocola xinjiangensis]OLF14394.1 hypothetical protein BLA60_04530 [Actinophytocola xinjiangensis]
MRRHVLRWAGVLRRVWQRHASTLACVPDPHGQFPALPLDWYLPDPGAHVHIPEQRTRSLAQPR